MSQFERPSESAQQQWLALNRQWQSAREQWNDEVSQRFEREFWSEWERVVPQTLELLRALEESLDGADNVAGED